jgi:cell division control protein 6
MGIFSELDESSVFRNEAALSTEYVPQLLPHRDGEIKQIARNFQPVARGRKPQNTFLFGPPGIGKTAVIKNVFREFEEYSEHVRCIYINCWDFRTTTALLTQLIIDLGVFVQRRGWSRDEIIGKLAEAIDKRAKGLVVCLDEVDQLDMSALYDMLRINQYVKTPVGIVFISNNPHVFAKAEPRIRSSLGLDEIEFKPYNLGEMKDILKERAKEAFCSSDPAVVTLCANHAVGRGGDVRVGLQCLLKAGRLAEQTSAKKISVAHAKAVLKGIKEAKPQILKELINKHEKMILEVLKSDKKLGAGELYKKYCDAEKKEGIKPVSDRALRKFVNHLEEIGLVKISEKKVGKSRMIWKA